ncbi:MAG: hypothetical protein HY077_16960 [Elusimicrobia bacterium]|nr:hypothetical protein [Elusimicrobiota bacterium]
MTKMKMTQKTAGRKTHVLHREDFTGYALDLGIWSGLTEDHGVSSDAEEIEITVDAVKEVAR